MGKGHRCEPGHYIIVEKSHHTDDENQNVPTPQKEEKSSPQDLSVLKQLLTENPHMAPAVKEALAKQGEADMDEAKQREDAKLFNAPTYPSLTFWADIICIAISIR